MTCFTHRSAYLSELRVLDFLFSEGKCILMSFKVLKSSFCVFAFADCSLLQRHRCVTQNRQGRASAVTLKSTAAENKQREGAHAPFQTTLWKGKYLQPLVEGWSCSELTRLKALELLGGEGL